MLSYKQLYFHSEKFKKRTGLVAMDLLYIWLTHSTPVNQGREWTSYFLCGGPSLGLCFQTTVGVKVWYGGEMFYLFFCLYPCLYTLLKSYLLSLFSNDFTVKKVFILSNLYCHIPQTKSLFFFIMYVFSCWNSGASPNNFSLLLRLPNPWGLFPLTVTG